jgi:hypothetical protein
MGVVERCPTHNSSSGSTGFELWVLLRGVRPITRVLGQLSSTRAQPHRRLRRHVPHVRLLHPLVERLRSHLLRVAAVAER